MCFAKSTVDNCQPDSSIIGISRFENFNYPSLKDHAENRFINFPRGGRELATAKELGFCTVIPVISLRSTDARERGNGTSPDYALTYASNEPRAPSQLGHLDCVEERQLGRIEGKDMEISVLKRI